MNKRHPFVPTVVQVRRQGDETIRTSNCATCQKPGRYMTQPGSGGRMVSFWRHKERPADEPAPLEACDWQGTGRTWCCRKLGHEGSHHAHRGPRRNGVS